MKKLCYVATIPAVVNSFLRGHIQAAAEKFQVTVICNPADKYLLNGLDARLILLPVERKPSPWKDAIVLFRLFRLFRKEQFDIVHSIMPKTGMLAMLAARLATVPVRIHTFTGQVWATKRGLSRELSKWPDKLIGSLASCVLTDSPSQLDFLISEGILPPGKAGVIGEGSICGVDPIRFHPDPEGRRAMREELGIAQEARVILFVGRLNRDKGILDLADAFTTIAAQYPNVELLLVGAEEEVAFARIQETCHVSRERLHYVSFTATPERYMVAADIFCLPSYREGFGLTLIEAAACGIPAVASRIYGITDAVEEGKTGLLFPAGDVPALAQALRRLLEDGDLRRQMGEAARMRALELFSSRRIIEEMQALYRRLLGQP